MIPVVPIENLLITYQNLSPAVQTAEAQKDVIAQALREAFPAAQNIIEDEPNGVSLTGSLREAVPATLIVECRTCPQPDGWAIFQKPTFRVRNFRGQTQFDMAFETTARDQTRQSWLVSVHQAVETYQVVATDTISTQERITQDSVKIISCTDPVCASGKGFPNRQEAEEAVAKLLGQVARRPVPKGSLLAQRDVAAEHAVRPRDPISVTYERAPGLVIRARGEAVSAGRVGDTIRVRLLGAQSARGVEVRALITGPGEVSYVE